jgi:hypothetical protein
MQISYHDIIVVLTYFEIELRIFYIVEHMSILLILFTGTASWCSTLNNLSFFICENLIIFLSTLLSPETV